MTNIENLQLRRSGASSWEEWTGQAPDSTEAPAPDARDTEITRLRSVYAEAYQLASGKPLPHDTFLPIEKCEFGGNHKATECRCDPAAETDPDAGPSDVSYYAIVGPRTGIVIGVCFGAQKPDEWPRPYTLVSITKDEHAEYCRTAKLPESAAAKVRAAMREKGGAR